MGDEYDDLGIILLAGGKSTRMGQDKGLLEFKGQPMIQWVIDAALPLSSKILIVSNNQDYDQFGFDRFEDIYPNTGPLGGLYTGLSHSKLDKNIILSCDVPFVASDLLQYIANNWSSEDACIAVHAGKSHQLIGGYNKSCLPVFKNQLEQGIYKITDAFPFIKVKRLDCDSFSSVQFTNMNSKADLSNK